MKSIEEIKEILRQHREELKKRFYVENIFIFGSYVRGKQKENSDIDILVEFEKAVSLLHIVSLEIYLTDILGIKADVVPRKNIREELKETILEEAVPL